MRRSSASPRASFTLVELLVAIAVTVLIVTLLSTVFSAAGKQWQASDQRIDSFRDARAALQVITRDLSRADINGDAQMLTLSDIDTTTGNYAKEVFAVTSIPNDGPSDLSTVGYYLVWDDTANAFTLKRLFRNSSTTVTLLKGTSIDFTNLYLKPTTTADRALYEEDLASYVWDLRFAPGTQYDPEKPTANPSTKWRWVEVRFKSMSSAAARKLRYMNVSKTTWDDPTDPTYRSGILPYEQQFVTRINLQQGP